MYKSYPVGWDCRIWPLHLCRGGVRLPHPCVARPPVGHGWQPMRLEDRNNPGHSNHNSYVTCSSPL